MQRSNRSPFRTLLAIIFFVLPCSLWGQAFDGYTLFGPNNGRNTYLINMSNQIVKTWTHSKSGGYSCRLMEDGSVVRTAASSSSQLNGGGAQGVVQKSNWAGTMTWEFTYSTSSVRSHHDIETMPNGNVLLIAWESKTAAQCVAAGLNHSATLWPDHIVEVQPVGSTGGNIVWQWHFWDHLIQDYDATKANYGVVGQHPELLDINVGSTSGDWMHCNGISYNPDLDQIVLSSHNLNEVYVIDHSTTTAEAAGHTGGRWGKGGDILYRWGKPSNYRAPGTQVFNVVHSAIWIPDSLPGAGHIMAFNNRANMTTSMVVEIVPPTDTAGNYIWTAGTAYGPASPVWSFTATGFFSEHLGSCQRLPNGNTLVCESTTGFLSEVTAVGATVWSYNRGGEVVRIFRFAPTYPGLRSLFTDVDDMQSTPTTFALQQNYPNPFNPTTKISYQLPSTELVSLKVFDVLGKEVATLVNETKSPGMYNVEFDAKSLPSGMYFYSLQAGSFADVKKLVLVR